MTQDNDREMKIVKIPLKDFIDTLMEAHAMGAKLIDLTVTKNVERDVIGITIREEYTAQGQKRKKLTEEMINELLQ
jgi:hypothetical protein